MPTEDKLLAHPDWAEPLPARLPEPSYWPAATALGINLGLMGFVTSYAFTVVGLALMAFSIGKWIGEMVAESRNAD
ncbi:MAG TPA: hypothetical protein VEJ86_13435 [Candidatus Binataceae bacterium]|nr:hypothetical protein [Candidatus Binataceae bacterium]